MNQNTSLNRPTQQHWRFKTPRASVATKIAFGFAVVLVLHLVIVILQHYGLQRAESDRQMQSALLDRVETFAEIDSVVSELNRNLLLFTFAGHEGPKQRVAKLANELEALLESAAKMDNNQQIDIDQEAIASMQRHLARYRETFATAVTDREKRFELIEGDLMRVANEFESLTEKIDQQAIESLPTRSQVYTGDTKLAFWDARLKTMQFVNDPDSNNVRLVKRNLNIARASLQKYQSDPHSTHAEQMDQVTELLDQYEKAFVQMVQATRNYLHLVNVVLAGEAQEFLFLAEKSRNQYAQKADRLAQQMEHESKSFRQSCNAVSILTVVLGLVATWMIRRNVVPPLEAITETLDGLSKGNGCREIPGLERTDELGKLAHAAEVFKNKAAETEKLLADVTRMEQLVRQQSHDQTMESLGQLAAGIAHEINTPMQCVASNVEYLEECLDSVFYAVDKMAKSFDEPEEKVAASLQAARSMIETRRFQAAREDMPGAVQDAAGAVRQVIEIVRAMKMMSHPGQATLVSTDFNQLISDASILARNRWKYSSNLVLDLEPDLPAINCMAAELSQVVLNLIVNAADSVTEKQGNGGQRGEIVVSTSLNEGDLTLKVSDTGMGIPADIQQKIFEPFFTTKDVGIGTGQGLAICYEVVKRHRGKIHIQSEEGKGTTFTITLPTRETLTVNDETAEASNCLT